MAQCKVRLLPGLMPSPAGTGIAAVATGGSFAAATYFWVTTYMGPGGETEPSNEVTVAIVLNGSATVSWAVPPPYVSAVNIYRGTSTGAENHLIATVGISDSPGAILGPYTDTGTVGAVQSPPAVTTFVNVTLDSLNRVVDTDATISSLATTDQQLQAIAACEEWQNSGGTSGDAQANANAVGLMLQWA